VTRSVLRSVMVTMTVSAAVAALTAGCGTPEAGAAATVDGRRISIGDVQAATTDIQAYYGPAQPVAQTAVLYLLAAAPYIDDITSQYRTGASVDDARAFFAGKVAHPSSAALTVIRANLGIRRLDSVSQPQAEQALMEVNRDLVRDGFTVNPRYGTFDPAQGSIQLTNPDWLTQTASTPSPAQ
jgi:hypothetical protein